MFFDQGASSAVIIDNKIVAMKEYHGRDETIIRVGLKCCALLFITQLRLNAKLC